MLPTDRKFAAVLLHVLSGTSLGTTAPPWPFCIQGFLPAAFWLPKLAEWMYGSRLRPNESFQGLSNKLNA